MKRILLSFFCVTLGATTAFGQLMAGVAQTDITPSLRIGYALAASVIREAPKLTTAPINQLKVEHEPLKFVELGLDIKQQSPYQHTMIFTLSNNELGYVPNAEAFPYGAYEVEVSNIAPGEGEKLVETAVALPSKGCFIASKYKSSGSASKLVVRKLG